MAYLKDELAALRALATRRLSLEEIHAGVRADELDAPPAIEWSEATRAACERAWQRYVRQGKGALVQRESLDVPVWIWLTWLVERQGVLLHGSSVGGLHALSPRVTNDNLAGGERPRIHAASSAPVALFYATIDRQRLRELPCIPAFSSLQLRRDDGRTGLWFAVEHRALPYQPWRDGVVYILPRAPFRDDFREMQWSAEGEVPVLAEIAVTPRDFPMHAQVYGLDFMEEARRTYSGVTGYPWRGDPLLYPDPRFRPSAR